MVLAALVAAAVAVALFLYWKEMYLLIRERMRLINYVEKIPGPYSIPILGTTWQFKWNIAGLLLLISKKFILSKLNTRAKEKVDAIN